MDEIKPKNIAENIQNRSEKSVPPKEYAKGKLEIEAEAQDAEKELRKEIAKEKSDTHEVKSGDTLSEIILEMKKAGVEGLENQNIYNLNVVYRFGDQESEPIELAQAGKIWNGDIWKGNEVRFENGKVVVELKTKGQKKSVAKATTWEITDSDKESVVNELKFKKKVEEKKPDVVKQPAVPEDLKKTVLAEEEKSENPNANLTKENMSGWLINEEGKDYGFDYSDAAQYLLTAAKQLTDNEVKEIITSRENKGTELAARIIFKDGTFERFTAKFDSRADVAGKKIAVEEAAAEIAREMLETEAPEIKKVIQPEVKPALVEIEPVEEKKPQKQKQKKEDLYAKLVEDAGFTEMGQRKENFMNDRPLSETPETEEEKSEKLVEQDIQKLLGEMSVPKFDWKDIKFLHGEINKGEHKLNMGALFARNFFKWSETKNGLAWQSSGKTLEEWVRSGDYGKATGRIKRTKIGQ